MIFRGGFILLFFAFAGFVNAKNICSTQRLSAILQTLRKEVRIEVPSVSEAKDLRYRQRPLRLGVDAQGELAHIGYRLFPDSSFDEAGDFYFLQLFLERYFLELDLQLDGCSPVDRLAWDQVQCLEGELEWRHRVDWTTPCEMHFLERRGYRVVWTLGTGKMEWFVPADCQLLLGADAVELENRLAHRLKRVVAEPFRELEPLLPRSFLSPAIRNDLYYRHGDRKGELIVGPENPVVSVKNLLLTGWFERPIPMDLTLDHYGYRTSRLEVTLQQYLTFCRHEGARLYVGVKQVSPEKISATLFALNGRLGCSHVLSVEFPTSILSGADERLQARLYAYIPLQNVTESFFMYE